MTPPAQSHITIEACVSSVEEAVAARQLEQPIALTTTVSAKGHLDATVTPDSRLLAVWADGFRLRRTPIALLGLIMALGLPVPVFEGSRRRRASGGRERIFRRLDGLHVHGR